MVLLVWRCRPFPRGKGLAPIARTRAPMGVCQTLSPSSKNGKGSATPDYGSTAFKVQKDGCGVPSAARALLGPEGLLLLMQ